MNKLDRALSENLRIMALVITEIFHRHTLKTACPGSMTRNQFIILKALSSNGEFQIGDLARLLDISPAAVSKNLDRLEQMKMVARQIHPDDRRSLELVLLEDGQKVVADFDRILEEKHQHLRDLFSRREKEILLDLSKRIIISTLTEEQNTELICLQCGGNCGDNCLIESAMGRCSLAEKQPEAQPQGEQHHGQP